MGVLGTSSEFFGEKWGELCLQSGLFGKIRVVRWLRMQKSELWDLLSGLCESEGVSLFDIEMPGASGAGVLRVYITAKDGVQHSHCTAVSRLILDHGQVEEILPGAVTLEVSSPGINRKLTRAEHFEGAVGERVRVSYRTPTDQKKTTVTGILDSFDGSVARITPEAKAKSEVTPVTVPFTAVQDARIDFLFE